MGFAGLWACLGRSPSTVPDRTRRRAFTARASAGSPTWSDYVVELDALKIDGPDALTIASRSVGGNGAPHWVIGGWGNQTCALEVLTDFSAGGANRLEKRLAAFLLTIGRVYHLRLEVRGARVRAWTPAVRRWTSGSTT